ncbi:hypothetical protein NHJ13051_004654 [Beauveria bassiana]
MKQSLSVIIDSTCNFQEVLDQGAACASQHNYTYCAPALIDHPLPRPPREQLEHSPMLVVRAETEMAGLSSVAGFSILAAHKTML